ncbi:hypothetical protein GGR50DRAFT_692822 [Xylaria sp. CBS 124048]|nr:hypothetical protein GGR50DRAFT_692822 [Xylaria sp. CBS 124048]
MPASQSEGASGVINQQQQHQTPLEQMRVIVEQPMASQPMNPSAPHDTPQMGLRGGDRSSLCPGRFCFCVPCPLPCDFCII